MDDLPHDLAQRIRRARSEAEAKLAFAQEVIDDARAYWATLPAEVRTDPTIQALMEHVDRMEAAGNHARRTIAAVTTAGPIG